MMIRFAHLREQGIDFAVFAADSRDHTRSGREEALARLILRARASGLKIDKAALAYEEHGRTCYFGTPDLVQFLANNGVPAWTHTMNV
ncbi:MAG TPA: hypothetical protein VMT19_02845 [Thermoanaerobaculaceae bacterium]|nr:hypothetical protein [Thermoanaerobaculaceae bacterium]